MWRLWLVGLLLLAPGESLAASRLLSTRIVECTATRAHAATATDGRQTLTLQNLGTAHVSIGSGAVLGLVLHAGSSVEFSNYTGEVICQTSTGTQALGVSEEGP